MYAPASIRNRLAAMRKGPSPPPPQAPPPMPAHSMETPPASIYHPMSSMSPYGVHGPPPPLSQPHDGYPAGPSAAGSLWQDTRGGMAMPHPLHASPSAAQQAAAAEAAEEERRNSLEGPNKYKKRSRAPAPSSCKNCGTNETPEWRRGPDGARTLCNACEYDVYYHERYRSIAHLYSSPRRQVVSILPRWSRSAALPTQTAHRPCQRTKWSTNRAEAILRCCHRRHRITFSTSITRRLTTRTMRA